MTPMIATGAVLPGAALQPPVSLITAAEARLAGVRAPGPAWQRVRPGVYAAASEWNKLPPWQRYRTRVCAYLITRPDAVLTLESAAAVHGLPLFGETRDIHVHHTSPSGFRRRGDVVHHVTAHEAEVIEVGGVRVTSLRDTVIDLARVLPPARALAVADAAARAEHVAPVTSADLFDRQRTQPGRRGLVRVRWVIEHLDAASESPGESVSRACIEWLGFETPELQRSFTYEGRTYRTDFHFASVGVIGESDGWGKYRLDDPEEAERILREEKLREDCLRRNGHAVARWTLSDAVKVDPLRTALVAAGVPQVRRSQPAMLATLTDRRRELPPRPPRTPGTPR